MSLHEPAQLPETTAPETAAQTTATRTLDNLDRLMAFFGGLERNVGWVVLLIIGAGVWYLGAIFITTALLRRSAAAQAFFVNLLADMQWSGYSILFVIGSGIALMSLIQLILWPKGWAWRWIAQRLGRPVAWASTFLWISVVVVESLLNGWGFEQWVFPWFIEASTLIGLTPTPTGLLVVSILVAPIVTLLPEWAMRTVLLRLILVRRTRTAAVQAGAVLPVSSRT